MAEYNWDKVNGNAVERLRKPKITPVPDAIIKLAQRSWDGVEKDGATLHVLRHQFADAEMAAAFAKHMRKAGEHTSPMTSVSVVFDPDESGNDTLVAWRAGVRRGRSTTAPTS